MSDPVERHEFEERRQKTIWERMDEIDTASAAGHARLRKSIDALEAQFDAMAGEQKVLTERLHALTNAPVDAAKLMLTSRAIIAVVLAALAIAGSVWGSWASTNSNISRLESKADIQNAAATAAAELQKVQIAALRDTAADAKATAADAKRQYELLRYDFQSMKEVVMQKGK